MKDIKSKDTKVYLNVLSKYNLHQRKHLGASALASPIMGACFLNNQKNDSRELPIRKGI